MSAPAGLPSLLRPGEVARVLNLGERTVKTWLDRGALPCVQPTGRSGARLVPTSTLAEFALAHGLTLHWEAVL